MENSPDLLFYWIGNEILMCKKIWKTRVVNTGRNAAGENVENSLLKTENSVENSAGISAVF